MIVRHRLIAKGLLKKRTPSVRQLIKSACQIPVDGADAYAFVDVLGYGILEASSIKERLAPVMQCHQLPVVVKYRRPGRALFSIGFIKKRVIGARGQDIVAHGDHLWPTRGVLDDVRVHPDHVLVRLV